MTWTDGGLATSLQERGLPLDTPVNAWVLARPEDVVAVHRAFVDAGAELILAGTFRALPDLAPDWLEVAGAAIRSARSAAAGRAEVWASIGPSPDPEAAATLLRAIGQDVDGAVLETFTDPEAARRAVMAVRRVWPGPLVASLVPRRDGRLFDGTEPHPALASLLALGADGAGLNCGLGPEGVLAAAARTDIEPLWARPAGGDSATTVAALVALADRCRWVGGCCGVGAPHIAEARRLHG